MEFDGSNQVFVEKVPNFEWTDPFSAAFWFKTTKRKKGFTQSRLLPQVEKTPGGEGGI